MVHERSLTLKETIIRRRRARYTELWALRDINLDIAPGEAIGIVGRNGSGKSTLLKLLAGIIPTHSGVVETGGSLASMLELGAGFHPDFTGRENVFMNGAIRGLSERQVAGRFDQIVDFAEVSDFIDMPVRTYSSGMQMRLAFAVAAHVDPDILLLDEVLAVGDEAFQRKCMGRIFDFRRKGGTLVFVSHDPNAVEQVCDRAVLVDGGRVLMDGSPSEVMARYHRLLADGSGGIGAHVGEAGSTTADDDSEDVPMSIRETGGWGTGDLTIADVTLRCRGTRIMNAVGGDPLTISFTVRSHASVPPPMVGISLTSRDGTPLFRANTTMAASDVAPVGASVDVNFEIATLLFESGDFDVNLALHSADGSTIYHSLERALSFGVFPSRPGVGLIDMTTAWVMRRGVHDGATADAR